LSFFFILLILAFSADKYNAYKVNKAKDKDELEAEQRKLKTASEKTKLRVFSEKYSDIAIIEIAQGIKGGNAIDVPEKD